MKGIRGANHVFRTWRGNGEFVGWIARFWSRTEEGDGVHGVRQRLIHGPKVLVGLVSSHMAGKTGLVQGCQTGVTETGERSTSANEEHVSEWVTKG